MRPFGEAQSKAMRAYVQSGQYHTIVESRVRLIVDTPPCVDPPLGLSFLAGTSPGV